jgi:hypothetical protein
VTCVMVSIEAGKPPGRVAISGDGSDGSWDMASRASSCIVSSLVASSNNKSSIVICRAGLGSIAQA